MLHIWRQRIQIVWFLLSVSLVRESAAVVYAIVPTPRANQGRWQKIWTSRRLKFLQYSTYINSTIETIIDGRVGVSGSISEFHWLDRRVFIYEPEEDRSSRITISLTWSSWSRNLQGWAENFWSSPHSLSNTVLSLLSRMWKLFIHSFQQESWLSDDMAWCYYRAEVSPKNPSFRLERTRNLAQSSEVSSGTVRQSSWDSPVLLRWCNTDPLLPLILWDEQHDVLTEIQLFRNKTACPWSFPLFTSSRHVFLAQMFR